MIHRVFLNTELSKEYEFVYIACYDDAKNNIESIDISSFDLIITQPVYQQVESKQTLGVLRKKNKNCVVIVFPSLYFYFYYPNLINLFSDNSKSKKNQLILPHADHDKNLLELYIKHKKDEKTIVERYTEMVLSDNFYPDTIYLKNYENSINIFNERFYKYSNLYKDFLPIYFVSITDFIEKHYRHDLIWHSNIHPKYDPVIKFICLEILSIIDKDINLTNKINFTNDKNYDFQLPLYQSISSLVDFDTIIYAAANSNTKSIPIEDFVRSCIEVYRKQDNAKYLNFN